MQIKYVSYNAWQKFLKNYPLAFNFLLHESLKGEKKSLESERYACSPKRRRWINNRLLELENIR